MKEQKKRDLPTGTLFNGNKNVLQKVEINKIYLRKNTGITLIALIISIIILLILAGVSLSALVGDNGILNQATNAADRTNIASEEEMLSQIVVSENADRIQNPETVSNYHIGTDLYDKTLENGDIWNIVVINETQEDYGTDWTYIEKGTELMDYGESKYSWLVNYNTGEKVRLEEDTYTRLDYSSSLAVTNGLVLNIDATNLEEGNWGDITVHGDVKYDSATQSLLFNEDTAANSTGEGGYLELTKAGLDFSEGFTFEIYCNLSRLRYDNGNRDGVQGMGLFCRIPSLDFRDYTASMRYGFTSNNTILKLNQLNDSINIIQGNKFYTNTDESVSAYNDDIFVINNNIYLTIVYQISNDELDIINVYINGEFYGNAYYIHNSYEEGLNTWNNDDCPFFIGVAPWFSYGNLYYLKGKVYSTRLYEKSLTENEVLENYNATIAYRSATTN